MKKTPWIATLLLLASTTSLAQGKKDSWQFGGVLDITHTTRALELGARDQGLQLGHSDLSATGPVGPWLRAYLGAVVETHDGKLEKGIEEAFLETTALPYGLRARAGRFASQVGYLNQQHQHADDFSERPLLYRAFFGGHWNDDGVRLNMTLPTPFYWMVGGEAFRGKKLVPETWDRVKNPGIATLVTKFGGDLGRSQSWQLGLSYIKSRRVAALEEEHEHHDDGDEGHEEGHEHEHGHGAAFSGRNTRMLDFTWKWAPSGNNREQQVRVSFETARITKINPFSGKGDTHRANALSVVWRFHPSWEVGARTDSLTVAMPHDDHFHKGRLREDALMLAWKPSHMQALRLQYSRQRDAQEFEHPSKRTLQLQWVLAFGGHGAHSF
ncbi:hypothetical protein [Inhella sp.]|uniref:hypothetical protein n=1 Tax=Inhella sp. TaxID=1921806 RepID=UPI0035AD9F25